MKKFFQFYDEFIQNQAKLDSDVFNHFQEMRFQIDQHREEIKKKIDDIALAMIDQTTKNEKLYLKNQKWNSCSFDGMQFT
jgi:predicted AlkP superfamily phosphohydrolase/phosphomutase